MLSKKKTVSAFSMLKTTPTSAVMVSTVDARGRLSDYLNRVAFGKERIILTRRDRGLVGLVPLEDIRLLEALEDKIDIDAARAALKEPGSVAWKDVKASLGL